MKKFLLLLLVCLIFSGVSYAKDKKFYGSSSSSSSSNSSNIMPTVIYQDTHPYPPRPLPNVYTQYNYNRDPYYQNCVTSAQGVFYNVSTRSYQYFPIGSPLNGYCTVTGTVYIPPQSNGYICMNKNSNEVVDCKNNILAPEQMACYEVITNKFKNCPKF